MRQLTLTRQQNEVIVCDRCGKEMAVCQPHSKQAFSFSFRGGYDSVFGDGDIIEGDFCESCIKEVLGNNFRHAEKNPLHDFLHTSYPPYCDAYLDDIARMQRLLGNLSDAIERRRKTLDQHGWAQQETAHADDMENGDA